MLKLEGKALKILMIKKMIKPGARDSLVILAIWEVELKKIAIHASSGQKSKNLKKFVRLYFDSRKVGVVACACHLSNDGKLKIGGK
jgi:hypothetical protein